MPYDELVKSLRQCAEGSCAGCKNDLVQIGCRGLLQHEAADAIEELSQKVQQLPSWISVEDRLPDSGVCVLVTDGLEVGEGWLTEITNTRGYFMRWCAPTADIDVDRRPITHWMPMPKAPMEGE